jgi:hypothetical protein
MAKPGKPIGAMHQSLNLSPWGSELLRRPIGWRVSAMKCSVIGSLVMRGTGRPAAQPYRATPSCAVPGPCRTGTARVGMIFRGGDGGYSDTGKHSR